MCEAYAAHLDTEKIKAACLPLSEEQNESKSCYPDCRLVQGKSETCSTGEDGWKGCSAINEGSFTQDGPQFKLSPRSPAGSLAYAHHKSVRPGSLCSRKTLMLE